MRQPHANRRRLALVMALVLTLVACGGIEQDDGALEGEDVEEAPAPQEVPGPPDPAPSAAPPLPADPATDPGPIGLSDPLPPPAGPLPAAEDDAAPFNPWTAVAEDPLSTFGLHVDRFSYARVRASLEGQALPAPEHVRVEEVVNAFDYAYTPASGQAVSVLVDGAAWPWSAAEDQRHLLRIGVASPATKIREPADFVLLVDTSAFAEEVLPLVQDSIRVLVDGLTPQDRVAIIAYADHATTVLDPTGDRADILTAANDLGTAGGVDLAAALVAGYDLAETLAVPGRTRRVAVLSANRGAKRPPVDVLDRVDRAGDDGVRLLGVAFGLAGANDLLLEELTRLGDGASVYIDSTVEAKEAFGPRLTSTLEVVAAEARSQVVFDPATVAEYRLIGYERSAVADDDFRDDTAVEAGELGAGHAVTALYELRLVEDAQGPLAVVSLRWLDPATRDPSEIAVEVDVAEVSGDWDDAPAALRLAGTAAAWADALRGSPHAPADRLEEMAIEAGRLADATQLDPVVEWADLVDISTQL